ncbi:MAG: branched-chain amino acid ABC transporter permease [Nocardiaceae bacterium]|nr:branched-chain amino acid ABC transporter permease [Nocardiaceae bacterium]
MSHAMKKARPRGGLGDTLRSWWDGLPRAGQWAFGVPIAAVLILMTMYPPPLINTPNTNFALVMAQVTMLSLVAIGLNVVVGQAGLLDLGYVGFYAIGAYTVAMLTSPNSPWHKGGIFDSGWAWLACVPLAVLITSISGLILGTPTLRLRGDYLAIVTLGFGEIVRLLADNLRDITRGSAGLASIAYPVIGVSDEKPNGLFSAGNVQGPVSAGVAWFVAGLILVVAVLIIVGNLERSRVGRAWVAIREDEDAAEIMGVPTFKFKLWAFVIGAAIGGLSGALYAGQVQFVSPEKFNVINSMLFLVAVIIGGSGNKLGVIVGAFVIVYLPNRLMGVKVGDATLGDYKYLFFGLALVVLMIFRPQGMFPVRQKLLSYSRKVHLAIVGSRREEAQVNQ